jgi:hypothetical protein
MCVPLPLSHGHLYVEFYRASAFDKIPVVIIEWVENVYKIMG